MEYLFIFWMSSLRNQWISAHSHGMFAYGNNNVIRLSIFEIERLEEMKLVIQRVEEASVRVDGEVVGAIGRGLLVLIGIEQEDTKEIADKYLKKLIGLRIFMDAEGKTNLSLADVGGELLLISQFTLCANCKKGNRPSFFKAGDPAMAEPLYEYMIAEAKKQVPVVERGVFGAVMKVSLINDGPFTIVLEDL